METLTSRYGFRIKVGTSLLTFGYKAGYHPESRVEFGSGWKRLFGWLTAF